MGPFVPGADPRLPPRGPDARRPAPDPHHPGPRLSHPGAYDGATAGRFRKDPVDQSVPAAPAASTPPGHPVIRATGVVKRWGTTTALDGATFDVPPGITGL